MREIIVMLLAIIEHQKNVITYLCILLFGKVAMPRVEKPIDKAYLKLQVDPLPVFGKPKIQKIHDCDALIAEKGIKPINRRGASVPSEDIVCPYCGASHLYIYNNNGSKGQFLCKVCCSTFFPFVPSKDTDPYCPYCGHKLILYKKRKSFDVYRCYNKSCDYRNQKMQSMGKTQRKLYESSPYLFKLRYAYRKFHVDFKPLSKESPVLPPYGLDKIKASPHVLGLVLTYHINYSLSLRKTAAIMHDVHNVKISYQTIANYVNSVAPIVKPLVDHHHYELSDSLCGDETYIKIGGKWHYVFFFFDAVKKIILSYRVQKNRDYVSAVYAINDVLIKLRDIPKNLSIITDGNPIYLLAQHFFAEHGINFDVKQVVGLTNDDPISKEYRPLKQIIERLNRTFKGNYKHTGGYGSGTGATAAVTMFVAYFNFLRPHSKLEGNSPVVLPELKSAPNMPAMWLKLIDLSQLFVDEYIVA
jgi:transposase-like protein/DNA-directed RNA polymerase subunit RPC12/RpoP